LFDDTVASRESGYGVLLGGKSLWIFAGTNTLRPGSDGSTLKRATIAWPDSLDATKGLAFLGESKDGAGVPIDALQLTREEAEFNRIHNGKDCIEPCGAKWELGPDAAVADVKRNGLLVFYHKILQRGSQKGDRVGTSLAVWTPGGTTLDRTAVGPGTVSPTMLFGPDEPAWGLGALVVDDWMYTYGDACGGLGCSWRLARVPLASALDRSAWQFFASNGRWSSNWKDAQPVLQGGDSSGLLSVHWNPFFGKFLAICSRALDARIAISIADHLEGPWSDAGMIEADTLHSEGIFYWTGKALGHPELARNGGRTEYVTYRRYTGKKTELRLMEIRFAKK
jgi:hypothetical protein